MMCEINKENQVNIHIKGILSDDRDKQNYGCNILMPEERISPAAEKSKALVQDNIKEDNSLAIDGEQGPYHLQVEFFKGGFKMKFSKINEAGADIVERALQKCGITTDFQTSRRSFTICAVIAEAVDLSKDRQGGHGGIGEGWR
jgi:uncharacterized protein (UPF0262 family)